MNLIVLYHLRLLCARCHCLSHSLLCRGGVHNWCCRSSKVDFLLFSGAFHETCESSPLWAAAKSHPYCFLRLEFQL